MFAPVAARRQGRDFKESGKLSLMTFAALFVSEKRDKRKSFFMILFGSSTAPTPTSKIQVQPIDKTKKHLPHPLFLRVSRHEEKAIKKKCHTSFRALRSATRTPRPRPRRLPQKAGENFNWVGENFNNGVRSLLRAQLRERVYIGGHRAARLTVSEHQFRRIEALL